jgi:hypothetical protein
MAARKSGSSRSLESVFRPGPVIMDSKDHAYNPCNDLIFPSIVKVEGLIPSPADTYYIYYAPHDAPGGICLAHAPSIEGPWKEHAGNPLIRKDWPPHYRVGHVSSPHAIWVEEESRLFVFYHGDNDQTHFAVSKDGIEFEYGGVAVDQTRYADYIKGIYDRVSYGRVFRHRIPSKDSRYVFLFARESEQGLHKRGIYLSWSRDARRWETPVRIIEPAADMSFVCSPCLFSLKGRHYVAYHADFQGYTDTYVDGFDAELSVRRPIGKLFDHRSYGETNQRVSDPLVFIEGESAYLVNAIGKVFNQRFALAKASAADLARALAGRR